MNMCGEAQPAVSQTSWRETPDNKAFEDATLLVECALISRGEFMLCASHAVEIASTLDLLMVCFDARDPFLGDQKHTNSWSDLLHGEDLCT